MRSLLRVSCCCIVLVACTDGSADVGDETESSASASTTGTGTGDSSDSGTETGDPAPDFHVDIQPLLEQSCICHFSAAGSDTMTAPYLNLNADNAIAELVDVDAVQLPSMKRVAPGSLDDSYLVHKLRDTHVDVGGPSNTNRMPPLAPLPDEQLQLIEAWIIAGANP